MGAPSGNHLIAPGAGLKNRRVIIGADGIKSGAHLSRVSVAPSKDIGHAKPAKPQGPRPPLAALDGGIVLHLGGGGGVEHHKAQPPPLRLPNAGQSIAIPLAVGIDRDAGRIVLDMGAGDHSLCWAIVWRSSRAPVPSGPRASP